MANHNGQQSTRTAYKHRGPHKPNGALKKAGGSTHTILNLIFKKLKSIPNNSILLGNTFVVSRNGWGAPGWLSC